MKKTKQIKLICAIPDKVDRNGVLIKAEAMKKMEQKDIAVLIDFDQNKPVGTADTTFIDGKGLQAKLKIKDTEAVKGLKPAICYSLKGYTKRDGIFIVKDGDLVSIGLTLDHADDEIKSI